MARARGTSSARARHRKVLKRAKGYRGAKSRSYKAANEQVMKSLQYAYRDRRARKGEFRRLWITRINAAARENGTTYSRLIADLKSVDFEVDRKILADIAVNDPETFRQIVEKAGVG